MLRQYLVGTWLGRAAMAARDALDAFRAVHSNLEAVGTVANDQLATRLVTRICRPGAAFVDVGAHIGSVIAAVRHHDASVRICAIEAVPEKASQLRRKFRGVNVHGCAVGDSNGTVSFFVDLQRPGYSSLDGRPSDGAAGNRREITVPLRRLEDVVTEEGVDVIKLDVEGAELRVLLGCERIVSRDRPVIMFESGPPMDPDAVTARKGLWQWMADRKYGVFVPNRVAHVGPPLTCEGFLESHEYPRRTTNYFAIPQERRVEVRDRARTILKDA
jgi:FkbM family methyltransferase